MRTFLRKRNTGGQRKHRRQRIVSLLAAVTVFITTYALILPAITLDTDTAAVEPDVVLEEVQTPTSVGDLESAVPEAGIEAEPESTVPEPVAPAEPSREEVVEAVVTDTPSNSDAEPSAEIEAYGEGPTAAPVAEPSAAAETDPGVASADPVSPAVISAEASPEGSPESSPEASQEASPEVSPEESPELTEEVQGDPTADVENAATWSNMFQNFIPGDIYSENLLAIARSQIGYGESTRNFIVQDGKTYGYTRYGAWYGNAYGDWCAMFVSFCLNYAQISQSEIPYNASCPRWVSELNDRRMFTYARGGYTPKPGDIIFFEYEGDNSADHVGIVEEIDLQNGTLTTIEGNTSGNIVKRNTYSVNDSRIYGYGILPSKLMAQEFASMADDEVWVGVSAETGALPAGTTMAAERVTDEEVIATIEGSVDGFVAAVQAVDITFRDYYGREIEPEQPVKVALSSDMVSETEPVVVQMDDAGEPQIMEEAVSADSCVVFDADVFPVYAIVGVDTMQTRYITADGESYTITVTYTPEANIPEGSVLAVSEIQDGTSEYEQYLDNAAAELATVPEAVSYARFFDIEILSDGQKVEPECDVQVSIRVTDAPTAAQTVVHFAEDGVEALETESTQDAAGGTELAFVTDGFSVYGVITEGPLPDVSNLDGWSFTLNRNGNYVTSEVTNAPGISVLAKTSNAENAAVWTAVAIRDGNNNPTGKYYITTEVNGQTKYLTMSGGSNNQRGMAMNDSPDPQQSAFSVIQNDDGTYTFAMSEQGGNTYYLNEWGNNSGYTGWPSRYINDHLTLTFSKPFYEVGGQYVVIVKQNGKYYSVLSDGSLKEVYDFYDPETNTYKVEMDYPLLWTYQRCDNSPYYNLCIPSVASGFGYDNLPNGYYYRYINPNSSDSYTEENGNNVGWMHQWSALAYENNTIHGVNYGEDRTGNYIGVSADGKRIVGLCDADHAAEIYLAVIDVPNTDSHDNHMVNHIDIAISGESRIKLPLAYGQYYDANGNVIYTATEEDHILEVDPHIEIKTEDMKHADVTATAIVDGERVELDDVFYITGYSQNSQTPANMAQVRLEGSFKVSNVPYAPNADNDPAVRQARKDNPIDYTVSVVKTVEVAAIYNGQQLYSYDVETNQYVPLKFNVPVTLSATFNYWDTGNKCPPLHINYDENQDFVWEWKDGRIVGSGYAMSGMDFELGTSADGHLSVPAIEVTKIIQKEDGSFLTTTESQTVTIGVYRTDHNASINYNSVVGVGVDGAVSEEELAALTSDYTKLHDRWIAVGTDSVGAIYDYDVHPGMIYIQEDPDSIDQYVTGTDGKLYQYVSTKMETEYAWRADGDQTKLHHANGTTSVPEVLGTYEYDGQSLDNTFLEFYIYNIYREVEQVDVPVDKTWSGTIDESNEYTWTATFVLQECEVHVDENDNPTSSDANTTVWRDVEGVAPLTISKGDSVQQRSFTNLPKYRYYPNGAKYRIMYSVKETAYELKHNGTTISKWDNVNGLTVGEIIYSPHFPHDAGDADDGSGIGENDPDFYHVKVVNDREDVTIEKALNLLLKKKWEDGALTPDQEKNASATFLLKRYVEMDFYEHINGEWVQSGASEGPYEDTVYTNAGHTYTLNKTIGWQQSINNLPSLAESISEDGMHKTVYHYSYYFVEVTSNPSNYYAVFTDADGNPVGDETHRIGEETEAATVVTIVAENREIPEFYVKKEWDGIVDPGSAYPEIRFTLYQGRVVDGALVQGSVFVGSNGERFENVPLNADNNWTWKCPIYLPPKDENGNDVGYYAVESMSGEYVNIFAYSTLNEQGGVVTYGAQIEPTADNYVQASLKDYYNNSGAHAARDGQTAINAWNAGVIGNTGTLTIVNRIPRSIRIAKIDELTRDESTTVYLSGALFSLYRNTGTSSVVYTVYNNWYAIPTGEDGTLTFPDLPDGQYKLVETKAPNGYVKLENNDVYFDIENGILTRYTGPYGEAGREVIDEGNEVAMITYVKENSLTQYATFTVGNEPGAALPSTGGRGTTIYKLGGILLILAAVISGFMMRRRERRYV